MRRRDLLVWLGGLYAGFGWVAVPYVSRVSAVRADEKNAVVPVEPEGLDPADHGIVLVDIVGFQKYLSPEQAPEGAVLAYPKEREEEADDYALFDYRGFGYEPALVGVPSGTTVVWVNRDPILHNVHFYPDSDENPLKSDVVAPLLGRGQRYAARFDQPGRYFYNCDPHPWMSAEIRVGTFQVG